MIECFMDTEFSNRIRIRNFLSLFFACFFLLQSLTEAATNDVYIVYIGENKYEDAAATKKSHHEMLSAFLGSKEAAKNSIIYSYKYGFSGFAASLSKSQTEKIGELPGVIQVFPNRVHMLHTTRSWEFIGLHHHSWQNLVTAGSSMGEGSIIGVIDSGIWPESESFSDKGIQEVPSRWKGKCVEGEKFSASDCNKKIIGARWFVKGVIDQMKKPMNTTKAGDFLSPRDGIGHGTHTASTAAGYFVEKANYRGLAAGVARGGAPLAHLAIYKACWAIELGFCTDADLLKAFDKAIHDGVDIISVSIGSEIPLFSYNDQRDSIAIGSFHANLHGITVVTSAGNDGPIAQTVVNAAPWLITVAATTIDRAFPTAITLGNHHILWGQSILIDKLVHGSTPLTYSERIALDPAMSFEDCRPGSLNASLAAGKIILCFGKSDRQDMNSAATNVAEAGGVGLIFAQLHVDGLGSCDSIPCVKVDYEVGTQILSYIRRARDPSAKLSASTTVIGQWVSPRVASFSSRGPSSMSSQVLKPDIAAPGVDIIAAYPPVGKKGKTQYVLLSGTSMACPHVAGIAALIKSLHRTWSPAAIRSALVTTASQTGTDGADIYAEGPRRKQADPFDIGGGQVNPTEAMNPGLIYDISTQDYIDFLCSIGCSKKSITNLVNSTTGCTKTRQLSLNLNLPSITIPNLKTRSVTVSRKVTNVGGVNSVYKAVVKAPHGVKMKVKPEILSFNSTVRVVSFKVSFFKKQKVHGDYKFGSLTWENDEHVVRSPVAVRVIRFESYSDV